MLVTCWRYVASACRWEFVGELRACCGRVVGALRERCGRIERALQARCGRVAGVLRVRCGRVADAWRTPRGHLGVQPDPAPDCPDIGRCYTTAAGLLSYILGAVPGIPLELPKYIKNTHSVT